MPVERNYIVLQCYGNEAIFYECSFALLSFWKHNRDIVADTEVWIYTDNEQWFDRFAACPLTLKFKKLNTGTLNAWRGPHNFVHRVKIEVLLDMAKNIRGNILYLDTDVVFTSSIKNVLEDISNGMLYMHVAEGRVSEGKNPIMQKLSVFLKDDPVKETVMWNAGVLGFHTRHIALLKDALDFTDALYQKFPKHIAEQFAFSVFFSKPGNIRAAAPYIIHYWSVKEVRQLFKSFFNFFSGIEWEQLAILSDAIQIPVLMQEKLNFFENRSIAGKIKKDKWQPSIPDWTELSKQL